MTLRTALPSAVRAVRDRPGLLIVGGAITVLQVLAWYGGTAMGRTLVPGLAGYAGPAFGATLAVLAWPLYAAVYVPATEAPTSLRGTFDAAVRAVRRHYRPLVAADLLAAAVAVAAAVGGVLLWLVASTAIRYGRYAVSDPGEPLVTGVVVLFGLAAFVGLTVGGLAVRFADAFVLFESASPRRGWRDSVRFARARPASLVGYGLVVALANAVPVVLARGVAESAGGGATGAVAAAVVATVLGGVALALTAALHAVYFRTTVAWTVDRPEGTSATVPLARVALAGAVVLAAVGGAVAVRVTDVRPDDRELDPLPDDPLAAYEAAAANTDDASRRVVLLGANASAPDDELSPLYRAGVDYRDRQLYVFYIRWEDGHRTGGFMGEGTMAMLNSGGWWTGWGARTRGNWTAAPLPGYGLAGPVGLQNVPATDVDWSVVAANDSAVVLRVERPSAIRDAFGPGTVAGMGPDMTSDSRLTVYVDRERRVVTHATAYLHSRETGREWRYLLRFDDVGRADLRRPAAVGGRHPLSWAWDALYY